MTIGVKIGVKILRINIKRLGLKKLKHNGHIKSIKTGVIKTIVEQLMIKFVNKINRIIQTTTNHIEIKAKLRHHNTEKPTAQNHDIKTMTLKPPKFKSKPLIQSSYPKRPYPHLPQQQQGMVIGFLLLIGMIVLMVLFVFYMITLDRTITAKFEGKRWNIPAKVYSKPLELYQGATVADDVIDQWLELLNYQSNTNHQRTGTYHKDKNTYVIHTRGFSYSGSDQDQPQIIKLRINGNKIDNIQSTLPNKSGIIRLEPVNIGGIYPDNNEDRVVIKLQDVPQPLIDALISTEDRSFYQHKGVSLRGIARAVVNNFSGQSMQGGSTITQQLIKNFYLNSERTLSRKATEALMAVLLEVHYDKNEILQTYLNEINLGQNGNRSINGFGLASQFYFNQPLNEIRVDQYALLVGLAKGPSHYNPRRNPEIALKRRNVVLNNMLITGKLSQVDYEKAINQPLDVVDKPSVGKSRFPDFLDIVKRELNSVYHAKDLKNEGLRIISTLDPIAQTAADTAVSKQLKTLRKSSKKTKELQGALVSANPQTGEVVAVVGSGSEFTGFNRAVDANRQVGSLLKPVIYMTALQSGKYNLASSVDDSPISIKLGNGDTWTPKNYSGASHGQVAFTSALANSYNQAAVRLGMEFGIDTYLKQLQRLGIKKQMPAYPSTLLGSATLSPMDMLGVYQVFASGGFQTPLHSIRSVTDAQGRILQRNTLKTRPSIPQDVSFLTNYALQQVVKDGTAKAVNKLGKNLNLAGKTGTTNDHRDAWFAGYSGNYVTVVWVGRDDNQPIGLSGSSGALPLWTDYMGRLKLTPVNLPQPDNIEWVWLENNDGSLSNEKCANARYLPALSKYIPTTASECAVNLYQEEQLQQQWLQEQQDEARQEQQAGNDENNDVIDNENAPINDDPKTNTSSATDTWYDKALEWF